MFPGEKKVRIKNILVGITVDVEYMVRRGNVWANFNDRELPIEEINKVAKALNELTIAVANDNNNEIVEASDKVIYTTIALCAAYKLNQEKFTKQIINEVYLLRRYAVLK